MADVKRGQLVKAADELNELLGISPPIDTKKKAPYLTKKCKEAAALLHPKDKVSEDTVATLEAIGAELPEKKDPKKAKGKGKPAAKKGKGKGKGKKKGGEDGITPYLDRLVSAVEDLNALEGLADEIETEDQDAKDLEAEIKNAADVIEEGDELQDDTWTILYSLKVGPRYEADQKKGKGKKGKGKAKTEPKVKGKGKDKKPADRKDKKPSNKARACELWDGGDGITDPAKIAKKLKDAVQESTIKSWLASWSKGNRLPAGF